MTSNEFLLLAGWAAYLSAAATIITFVTGILFFTRGQPFGTANDAASVVQLILMVPIAIALHQLFGPEAPTLSLLAAAVGITGMLVAAVLQALLVLGRVEYEETIRLVLSAGGMVGIWLALTDYLALATGTLPSGLA